MQKQKILDLDASVRTLERVCSDTTSRDGRVWWGKEPQHVITELMEAAIFMNGRYVITYNRASLIMENAKTSKLASPCNEVLRQLDMNGNGTISVKSSLTISDNSVTQSSNFDKR